MHIHAKKRPQPFVNRRVRSLVGLLYFVLVVMCAGAGCEYPAPGVVIDYEPSPSLLDILAGKDKYIGSPSIAILPNGDYAAAHDIFGDGSTEDTLGITKVFRSIDRGMTWTQTATLEGQFWSTLFVHNGDLYIFGYTCSGEGDIVIRRSADGGSTWTTPTDSETGLLRTGNYGGTPNRPIVFNGRLWIGQSTRLMSAPIDADLLKAASWTLSNGIPQNSDWLDGRFEFWSEGQTVASPDQGVVVLPKVKGLPYTALLRSTGPGTITFDENNDFVELPGGEKKFGAAYDTVSGCFYILSNPVLPEHKNDPILENTPEMIRNTAALLVSKDLTHWDVEKIFLYSPNIYYEAFQYLNFEFDGEDLAVVSRTAFNVGGNLPPRGHDSNLLTFHRIQDFRDLSPDHVLIVDTEGDQVFRFEETQNERAPLGAFPLGSTFGGAPLNDPVALAQDEDGYVYILEQAGRILKFDAAGNFIAVVASAPVSFQTGELSIAQPAEGEQSWVGADSNQWEEPTNWYYWGRPDTPEETAVFGSAAGTDSTVTLDRSLRIKGLRFRNTWNYTLAGTGNVVIQADGANGVFLSELGQHTIQLPVILGSDAEAQVASGASLGLEGGTDLDGRSLDVSGGGLLTIDDAFAMHGGRLIVSAEHPVHISDSANLALDGTLELMLSDGGVPTLGQSFDLLDFTPPLSDSFETVVLPDLPAGLDWDTSQLYTTGVVQVVSGT